MDDGRLYQRQRAAVRRLQELVADRAEAEVRIKRNFQLGSESIEREHQESRQAIDRQLQADLRAIEKDFRSRARQMKQEFETELSRLELEYESSVARIQEKAETNEAATRKALQEALWLTETVFEATESQPHEQYQQVCKGLDGKLEEVQNLQAKADDLLKRYRQTAIAGLPQTASERDVKSAAAPAASPAPATSASPAPADTTDASLEFSNRALDDHLDAAKSHVDAMASMFIPRFFQALWPALFALLIVIVAVAIGAAFRDWTFGNHTLVHAAAGFVGAILLLAILYFLARTRIRQQYAPLRTHLAEVRVLVDRCRNLAALHRDQQIASLAETRDRDLRLAREKYEPVLLEIQQRREHHLQRLHEKFPRLIQEHKQDFERNKKQVDDTYRTRTTELQAAHGRQALDMRERYATRMAEMRQQYQDDWTALESRWKSGMAEVYESVDIINREIQRLFPDWPDPSWNDWQPPVESAPIICFGRLQIDLQQIPGGLPQDERLIVPGPTKFTLPAMLAFPEPCSLLVQVGHTGGRDAGANAALAAAAATTNPFEQAVRVLQTVMFRLLTSIPPSKVRFTIIDPIGLGQNFAGFMHLADYDGAYVTDKIWTEDRHIEQRLLDLTEHMENVIQKYLRNEYETIAEYNIDAGEIAEPYRFLVIANFPVNFTETAARRLASIVASGARCGVYTLISVDARHPMPPGFQLTDLERNSVKLVHEQGRFVLKDPEYAPFPLGLDQPPDENFLTQKLHLIGQAAKDLSRVEVPFDVIAPDDDELWSGETTTDLRVALGRAGATKLQHLTLGVGTAQHALIAGKTGSGKSTLLHALITNLALWYSPDEVEFYLVDFKKGVEFKTYATHDLPHARAVAIESDREFGLSVLQRLDAELKHRGNLFRDLGVQDLAGYRKEQRRRAEEAKRRRDEETERRSDEESSLDVLPRTLLIIDEFQELFVEDDKIAQDAALLLDRLVRQGRAFGMHVLLGSQTLGGAYSLARSTINQMAVRIALQCSEADSYLILSDDNAAARLLSRPGEAIYNDASGMVEGNNPFQIVWLPDHKRDECLQRVRRIAQQRGFTRAEPQIVFEGNVPAEIERNHLLEAAVARQSTAAAAPPPPPAAAYAWLGEAIAIKDPTAAVFRRQSGSNLLIIGQREEAALAMMATSLISLAAQHHPATARFHVLDGSPPDAPYAGYLQRIAAMLPHDIRVVAYRDVPSAINDIVESMTPQQSAENDAGLHGLAQRMDDSAAGGVSRQRLAGATSQSRSTFLLIYGLQRFRMLRQEDDYGFSSSLSSDGQERPQPDKQFGTILREGAHHGIHVLAWCDSPNNLNRSLDRQGLKEFETRVLFQMGANDSSNLIDSPLASKLGLHRALFFSEEQGYLEKFRPYALPDEQWVQQLAARLCRQTQSAT